MTLTRMIAVLALSMMSINCSSESGADGPNFPGSTENDYSLLFDGVDGFGSAGNISTTLGDTIERFSVSLWFKAADTPDVDAMMLHMNPEFQTGVNSMQVRLYWQSTTQVAFQITPDFAADPGATLTAEVDDPQEWNHVVLTFDASAASNNVRLYLNGTQVDTGDQSETLTAVGNIQFAREGSDLNYYNGYLDEVAFWEETLVSDDVEGVYNEGKPKNVRFDFPGYTASDSVRSLWRMGDENFMLEENVSDLVGENHFTIVGGGAFERDVP
ncbi:MAG: LamG domain-containing protein [Polyangiales bacterium]